MGSSGMPDELLGRQAECGAVDDWLVDVRGGRSVSIVVRGEPGIGKTTLVDYVQQSASDCLISKASGVESEMELAFGGLHQLCAPFLDRLDRLPPPSATRSERHSA